VPAAATAAPAPAPAPPAASGAAADLAPATRVLSRVTACAPEGDIPAKFDRRVVVRHCLRFAPIVRMWHRRWVRHARPFLAGVVPDGLPRRVVYPFGGGDLLTALVTFPRAAEITTLSLEPAGDPRALEALEPDALEEGLDNVRTSMRKLMAVSHSKTTVMGKLARGKLPGDLTYSLVALAVNDMVPLAVRFFRVRSDGGLDYYPEASLPPPGASDAKARAVFANVEIEYAPRAGGERRVFRHITANLDDEHLAADPGVLRHLEQKGEITAMTKAASYLLWWGEFSLIRRYLLTNMAWMISDSTGIPVADASAAGFEQIPYGRFEGPFLGKVKRPSEAFRALWKGAPQLAFFFGYPDRENNAHLLVTRRRPATAEREPAAVVKPAGLCPPAAARRDAASAAPLPGCDPPTRSTVSTESTGSNGSAPSTP
jgi:hypothetical protein